MSRSPWQSSFCYVQLTGKKDGLYGLIVNPFMCIYTVSSPTFSTELMNINWLFVINHVSHESVWLLRLIGCFFFFIAAAAGA